MMQNIWKDAFIPSPAKNDQQLCFEKIVQEREQKTFVSTCNFFTISISFEWLYFLFSLSIFLFFSPL